MIEILPTGISRILRRWHSRLETETHQLHYLFLEITRLCNLRCRHCGSDCSSDTHQGHLTTDSWIKIVHYLADTFSPTPILVLSGGEPILHGEFERLIEAIYECGMRFGMVSNGYALEKDRIDLLMRNKMESITVSLDGLEPSHNFLRGKSDAFRRTVRALNRLAQEKNLTLDVVTCVHPAVLKELDAVAELLISMRVPRWRLFRIFPAGRAKNNSDLHLDRDQTWIMINWIANKRQGLHKRGLNVSLSCEGWLPPDLDMKVRESPFFCRAGVNIASILCDGTITGCTNNSAHFQEGNIMKNDFAHAWQNGFGKFRNREWVYASSCGKCKYLKECRGGSIHLWQSDLNGPDFCCMESEVQPD